MNSAPEQSSAQLAPVAARQGHDELNLAEFPLVLLAKRPRAGLQSIEYQDEYPDATGRLVTRKVTISGAGKYGLPTAQDEDVLIALMYLTLLEKETARPVEPRNIGDATARTVHFTRPQLFQILGWSDTGDNYERLKKSLRRWKGVTIVYENWTVLTGDGERRATDETGFSLLDNYELADGRSRPREPAAAPLALSGVRPQRSLCSITWNKTPFANFQSGYLKTLDLDRYFQLPTAAAKRAFRYLDKHLPADGIQEFDLYRFACQHVGFSTRYKPSRLRHDVEETVVRPLERARFLAPMAPGDRFPKCQGSYRIVFARSDQATMPIPAAEAPDSAELPSPLMKELKRHSIGGKAAQNLIASHPAEYIQRNVDYLDFLIETGQRPRNPAGWLRAAIEQDYGPPAGYVAAADRKHQEQASEEKRRREQEDRAAVRRQEEEEAARRKAERNHIDAYLNALMPPERKALEEQAVAGADENMRQMAAAGGPFAEVALRILVDRAVLRVRPLPVKAE